VKRNKFKKGDNLAVCDICGFTYYASQLRMTWDGLAVCKEDYEPKHPQLEIKARKEDQSVRINRKPADQFTVANSDRYVEIGYWLSGYAVGD